MSSDVNYLKNVKKIVEPFEKICKKYWRQKKAINAHLEKDCQQQNLGFINNSNIKNRWQNFVRFYILML